MRSWSLTISGGGNAAHRRVPGTGTTSGAGADDAAAAASAAQAVGLVAIRQSGGIVHACT